MEESIFKTKLNHVEDLSWVEFRIGLAHRADTRAGPALKTLFYQFSASPRGHLKLKLRLQITPCYGQGIPLLMNLSYQLWT